MNNTMKTALEAIATMKVNENTNYAEALALCIVIASVELSKEEQ